MFRSKPGGQDCRSKSSHPIDRKKLLERQRSGKCLGCGSTQHKIASCPKRSSRTRPPTPRGTQRQRVNFRVSSIGETPASGREENVEEEDDELIVDSYIEGDIPLDPTAELAVSSEEDALSDY